MEWQVQILHFFETIRTGFLTTIAGVLAVMADKIFLIAIISGLYWCVDKVKSTRLAWLIICGDIVNKGIKNIICMPRPFEKGVVMPINAETASGYSFPSGHTQGAVSFWGGSILIFRSKSSMILGTIFIVLTALSRLYLGLHWPMDVIGGILFGGVALIISNALLGEEAKVNRWHIIVVSGVVLIGNVFPIASDLRESIAALWGLVCGVYMEQKYIQFKPMQKWQHQIIKIVIGTLGLVVVYAGFKRLFPSYTVFNQIRYALILLWIFAGAPYLFKRFKYLY